VDGIFAPVRTEAGHIEASERISVIGSRHDQVCVAHRCREEPFVPAKRVFAAATTPTDRVAVVVFARTSDPPCFSVMPMPNQIKRLPEIGPSDGS
jgi:hypothetical protein